MRLFSTLLPPFTTFLSASTSSFLAAVTAGVLGEAGACSSILLSKYFFGGLATVSSLLPLRGGIVGGARAVVEAGRRPTPLVVVLDDITGLVVDCLVEADVLWPLDSLETRLMVGPEVT